MDKFYFRISVVYYEREPRADNFYGSDYDIFDCDISAVCFIFELLLPNCCSGCANIRWIPSTSLFDH